MTTHRALHREARLRRRLRPIRLSVGMGQKVGIPNSYGSYEASLHISGVTAEHTDEMIEAAIARSVVTVNAMRARLVVVLEDARKRGGFS